MVDGIEVRSVTPLKRLGIPSTFKVHSQTIRVVEVPDLVGSEKYGDWDNSTNEIRLFTKGVCDDVIIHTYYHELIHCLFDKSGYSSDGEDETKVDQLAGLLAQIIQTSK